jgi:hypothetical protein
LLPHWVQRLAAFLPATYLVVSFQAIMVQGQSLLDHWAEMIVLVVSGTFGLLFAWKLFRWEKDEKISTRAKWLSLTFIIPFLVTGTWMNARGNLTSSWAASYYLMGRGNSAAIERAAATDANLIENFESPGAAEDLLKRWEVSTDSGPAGHSMAELSLISPGAAGTQHALRFKGHLAPAPGNGEGFALARFEVRIPAQARDLHGIEFQVRGDGRAYQVKFRPAAQSGAGGDLSGAMGLRAAGRPVTATASFQPTASFVPLSDWQGVQLLVGWLANPPAGSSASGPWVLEISAVGPPGDFQLDLDEIKFY